MVISIISERPGTPRLDRARLLRSERLTVPPQPRRPARWVTSSGGFLPRVRQASAASDVVLVLGEDLVLLDRSTLERVRELRRHRRTARRGLVALEHGATAPPRHDEVLALGAGRAQPCQPKHPRHTAAR